MSASVVANPMMPAPTTATSSSSVTVAGSCGVSFLAEIRLEGRAHIPRDRGLLARVAVNADVAGLSLHQIGAVAAHDHPHRDGGGAKAPQIELDLKFVIEVCRGEEAKSRLGHDPLGPRLDQ